MNIIINGGTRGIGKEVALNLAADKSNNLLITGRNEKELKSLASSYANIKPLVVDLSEFDNQGELFFKYISAHFKYVDVLLNVAGMLVSKEFLQFANSDARRMMETNFFGPATVIRLVAPLMKKGSHIVNISSMGGFQGSSKYPGLSYYSASKAALACLTECLAAEFAPSGITVNCLALGSVQTEMLAEAFPGYKAPVDASQMAQYISWFATNGNKYFNGKILPVALSNP